MRRRQTFMLLSGATVGLLASGAQSAPRVPCVGYIIGSSPAAGRHILEAFLQGLNDLGYIDGKTVRLEVRWAEGRAERMPELVNELIRLNADVLVTGNSQAALAAQRATRTIPIVMFAGDPVGLGLVSSLAHPGGNVTGLSYFNVETNGKRLELLKDVVPGMRRVAVLTNPGFAMHAIFWKETQVAARKMGLDLLAVQARAPDEFEAALKAGAGGGAQALLAFDDPLTIAYRPRITALAARVRLPAMYGFREFPDDGGLMSYGPNFAVLFRRAATFVDKILKGTRPADLPVEQPTKYELVINLKAARALGLTIPATFLARADEVIE